MKLVVLFFFRGLGSTTGYICYPCCFSCMKMEDYETFCKKHLSRIQEEATKGENSSTSLDRNVSLIQFHGVPVLSPLVRRCFLPAALTVLLALMSVLTVLKVLLHLSYSGLCLLHSEHP